MSCILFDIKKRASPSSTLFSQIHFRAYRVLHTSISWSTTKTLPWPARLLLLLKHITTPALRQLNQRQLRTTTSPALAPPIRQVNQYPRSPPESSLHATKSMSQSSISMISLTTVYRHDKEVTPAPGATSTTTTSAPLEKTAWQGATQTPAPQPGQGLIAQRTVDLNQLGEEPRLVNCPFCHHQAMTRVQKESTSATG